MVEDNTTSRSYHREREDADMTDDDMSVAEEKT